MLNLRRAGIYLLLLFASALIYAPVMRVATSDSLDFRDHIQMAEDFPDKVTHVTHALFHGTYRFIAAVAPENTAPSRSALIAALVFMLPLPMVLFWLLRRFAGASLPDWLTAALAIGLTLMAPVTLGAGADSHMNGYINTIVYHNPTLLAMRLFILPISLLALRAFDNSGYRNANQRLWFVLLTLALVMAATQAKPSYTIVLLPGCCLLALYRRLRGEQVDWALLIGGICLPGVGLLVLQYLLSYINHQDGSHIAFGFLTYLRLSHEDWQIGLKFALSLLFPLGVCWLYRGSIGGDLYLRMSWLIFGLSLILGYGFYEHGPRAWHGNLVWSSYSALFVLMVASLLFVLARHDMEQRAGMAGWRIGGFAFSRRAGICMLLFAMHLVSGVAYCWRFLQGA